jgi:hypothetical protein
MCVPWCTRVYTAEYIYTKFSISLRVYHGVCNAQCAGFKIVYFYTHTSTKFSTRVLNLVLQVEK